MKLKRTLALASTSLLLVGCGSDKPTQEDVDKIVNYLEENGKGDNKYIKLDNDEKQRVEIGREDPESGINKGMLYFVCEDITTSLRASFTAQWKLDSELIIGSFYIQPVNVFVNHYESVSQIKVKDHKFDSLTYQSQIFNPGTPFTKADLEAAEVRMAKLALDLSSEWLHDNGFSYLY